jgi:hypothetical protein
MLPAHLVAVLYVEHPDPMTVLHYAKTYPKYQLTPAMSASLVRHCDALASENTKLRAQLLACRELLPPRTP